MSHNLFLLGCFWGTLSPSFHQSLSARLWLTLQPSCHKRAVILRYPYLPYFVASSIMRTTSRSSSGENRGLWRCVDRHCPRTLHARLSETASLLRTRKTVPRLRDGLTSFPLRPLLERNYLMKNLPPVFLVGYLPARVLSASLPARPACLRTLFSIDSMFAQ